MFLIIIIAIVFGIWGVWYMEHSKNVEDQKECSKGEDEYDADVSVIAKHICGLPLGEKSECKLYLSEYQVIIESYGNIFK